MITLRDSVTINATPSEVFNWFMHLDKHYLSWHPDHLSCSFEEKQTLETGATICAEEYLHSKLHKLKFHLTKVIPNKEIEFKIMKGLSGRFLFIESGSGVKFISEIRFGWDIPIIGTIIDKVGKIIFSKEIGAQRQHMKEEGENLKRLLEKSKV